MTVKPLTTEQVLAVVGDLELERRSLIQRVVELEERAAELEDELARQPPSVQSDS